MRAKDSFIEEINAINKITNTKQIQNIFSESSFNCFLLVISDGPI